MHDVNDAARDGVRALDVAVLRDAIATHLVEANYRIPEDVLDGLRRALVAEQSDLGRHTLSRLIQNYEVAAAERLPVCQDIRRTSPDCRLR